MELLAVLNRTGVAEDIVASSVWLDEAESLLFIPPGAGALDPLAASAASVSVSVSVPVPVAPSITTSITVAVAVAVAPIPFSTATATAAATAPFAIRTGIPGTISRTTKLVQLLVNTQAWRATGAGA